METYKIFGDQEHSLIEMTLGDLLDKVASVYPENDCVVCNDKPFRKTYKEFKEECDTVAKGLMALGVEKGSHVAIWATNYPEWIVLMYASAKIGATLVTVNTNYKVFEAEYLLKQSDTDTLVMMEGLKDTNYTEIINELCPELKTSTPGSMDCENLPYLKRVIYLDSKEKTPQGMLHWSELHKLSVKISDDELRARQASVDCHDVVNMQYTSGTTGFPKGVMLTHYNILNNGKCIGDNQIFTYRDRVCLPVPFFHCFGCVLGIMACITHGSTIVPVERYNPVRVMNTIQGERCTATYGVPTMYIAMLEHPDFPKYDFSSLRTGIMSGSPCPVKVMEQVVNLMNMREITIPYGLTEVSPVCTMTNVSDSIEKRVSTVGRKMPFVEVKVVDPETYEELPPNTPGEVVVRGYSVMKGYYKMPEATAQAIDKDGWLHSGDLAAVDPEGYFHITGRIKDMIIRGGENIYPKELEEFLYTNPKVKDVQVIGVPDKNYGEEVCACVILKQGETATEDELKEFIRENLSRHKMPRYIWFMDTFPMTASGKIQKYKMREMAVDALNLADAAAIETA
ncbi:MAG: AMP-binding protein [Clostridiales bacterium]|nr:AMP-binding protein [Clostridiales bacterium]